MRGVEHQLCLAGQTFQVGVICHRYPGLTGTATASVVISNLDPVNQFGCQQWSGAA